MVLKPYDAPRDEGTSPPVSAAPPRGPGLCQTWFQQPRPCRWPRACHTPWPDLSLPVCKAGGRPLAFETRVPSQAVRTGRPPLLFLLAREGLLWNTANTQQPWCPRYPPLLPGLSWGRQPAPRAGGRQAGRLRVSSASRLRQRETGCHLPASGAEIPGRAPREGVPVGRRPPSRTSPAGSSSCACVCACPCVCARACTRALASPPVSVSVVSGRGTENTDRGWQRADFPNPGARVSPASAPEPSRRWLGPGAAPGRS